MLWTKFNKELKENVYLPYLCFLIKGLGEGRLTFGEVFFFFFFQSPFSTVSVWFYKQATVLYGFFKCTF